ncbi:hypothetical protein [Bradyrhizobium sp. Ai1a-2]|uniref:hypothetical protein n=1 Tax=Bradyrhizobium sp. Ai1a-2 TaxID=196490 RepID=UPI0003FEFCC3|nr:hypothetical protein [Bradyrhizobium sp. Ai1a-2]
MADPVFDPSQPFENVDTGAGSAPVFDASQPFENVNTTPKEKSFRDRVNYAWEHATPGGPLWMAKEIVEGARGAVQGSEAATAPQVGSEIDVANQRALAEAGPGQAFRAASILSPGAPMAEGEGAAARGATEAAAPAAPTPPGPAAPPSNPTYAAAQRISEATGQPVNVPAAFASDSQNVQRMGQFLKSVPLAGNPIPQAVGQMHNQLGEAARSVASGFGEGSGPNVSRRIGESIEDQAAAEDAARQAARQREVDNANAQIDQHEAEAHNAVNRAIGPETNPQDMGEALIARLQRSEGAARAEKEQAYQRAGEAQGAIDLSRVTNPQTFVTRALEQQGEAPDDVLHPAATRMLGAMRNIGNIPPDTLTGQAAEDAAAVRARYGDQVANAFERQQQAAAQPAQPQARSLTEFLARQGGLGPDAELDAIGAGSHTVNVGGVGRRKLVRQGGLPLDVAREAAEEAGYLRGDHNGTSTVNDLLDALDAEIRGQPRYPEGFEGTTAPRQAAARSEREAAEQDAALQGAHDDLSAAGYGDLGQDVRNRAAGLMVDHKMSPDDAVENAFQQLEQEDAARTSGFPGDQRGQALHMRGIERTRQRLNFLSQGASTDGDRRAARNVMREFENWTNDAFDNALMSGSDDALKEFRTARAANRDWRTRFGWNERDDADKMINRIVTGTVTPQEFANKLIGETKVGAAGVSSRLYTRVMEATGNAPEAAQAIRGGIWNRLTQSTEGVAGKDPNKVADGIYQFFNNYGRDLANKTFTPEQKRLALVYADTLRRTATARAAVAERAKEPVGIGPMRQLAQDAFGKKGSMTDEQMYSAIDAYARSGGRGDLQTLSGILKAVPENLRGNLAGAIVRRLGRDPRDPNGFALERFAGEWSKYSSQAKTLLFGNAGSHRQSLDDIAAIGTRYGTVGRRFGNPSGTGQTVIGAGEIIGLLTHPLATIGALLGGYATARILAAPQPARRLATWAKSAVALRNRTPERLESYARASSALVRESRKIGVPLSNGALIGIAQGRSVPAASDTQQ